MQELIEAPTRLRVSNSSSAVGMKSRRLSRRCPLILLQGLTVAALVFLCHGQTLQAQNLTTVAGVQGDSTGTNPSIGVPNGVAVDSLGNIYTASSGATNGSTIYKITPGGTRTIYAGVFGVSGFNGDGTATSVQLNTPQDVWMDSGNNLYILDQLNRLVRKVTTLGALTTVAGVQGDSSGAANSIGVPNGVAVDSLGNIYVAASGATNGSTIYKITPGGTKTLYAGVFGVSGFNGDGTATSVQLNTPQDVWIDSSDNLYIADQLNRLIRKVTPAGALTTVAGVQGDSTGGGNSIGVVNGVAVDMGRNIYVAATGGTNGSTVYKITPAGIKTIFAGVFGTNGFTGDGTATAVQLNTPQDVWYFGTTGKLYIADQSNRLIRKVDGLPTAANGAVIGRITDDAGNPVEGAVIRLNGTQNRKSITDANGNYGFAEVETNGFYTVTPSRVNYNFAPATRSFSALGAHTEASFTGNPNGRQNPLDTPEYFVRQQYLDFLSREPDESGFNFWSNQILSCNSDVVCVEGKRADVSAAFFLSIEFQQTGYLVHRMYQAAYGDLPGAPVPIRRAEFKADTAVIGNGGVVLRGGWEDLLEGNKEAYATAFVQRARFLSLYGNMSDGQFVDTLNQNAGMVLTQSERDQLVSDLTTSAKTRAQVLRSVAENPALAQQEFNQAFVLMQYFSYLQRDPNAGPDTDFSGYNFWLNKLNTFGGNYQDAEMVRAFLVATEYRGRFPR